MKYYNIAGIKVTPSEYQRLKFVITNNVQAGAKPTEDDIRELIKSERYPNEDIKNIVNKLDVSLRHDE